MKVEDSGMPEEIYWNSLFNIGSIIEWLALPKKAATIVEIGCGYGTFTVPLAKRSASDIYTFDIEPSMIEIAQRNARKAGLLNITFGLRDILEQGTGLESNSADMVLLFNILHCSEKRKFLEEASRILIDGGIVAIIHWRKDIPTPRGPAIDTRPDEDQILSASDGLNLDFRGNSKILKPYHWGIQLVKEVNV
ncbi:class I SAM-dependent methyltransferase [Photobacterium sagamiensis]|uniref:class I SAM-dependent methyltransferase n=1 Tax=Photobacterium sagamiensis TaxID=2910241 RepID=UPI003D0D2985